MFDNLHLQFEEDEKSNALSIANMTFNQIELAHSNLWKYLLISDIKGIGGVG